MPEDEESDTADEALFVALYRRHYPSVRAYVTRRTSNQADVDDVVNRVFDTAWRKFGSLPGEPSNRQWLYLTARHLISNHERGLSRRLRLLDRIRLEPIPGFADYEFDPGGSDDPAAVRAFQRLRAPHQEVLALIAWEGLTPQEAAESLNLTVNTFNVRLHRARRAFQELLEQETAVEVRGDGRVALPPPPSAEGGDDDA